MPHDLLAAPFLGRYLLLRPGSTDGVQLPRGHFGQLAQAAAGGSYPPWLPGLARRTWQVNLPDTGPMNGRVLVREESPYGYGRASWEINLGCNYACYLGLKEFSGLPWPGKARLLGMMRDAGVVWLQITCGEPTIDKDFADAYRLAFELGMMLTVSTNGSRLWRRDLLELFTGCLTRTTCDRGTAPLQARACHWRRSPCSTCPTGSGSWQTTWRAHLHPRHRESRHRSRLPQGVP